MDSNSVISSSWVWFVWSYVVNVTTTRERSVSSRVTQVCLIGSMPHFVYARTAEFAVDLLESTTKGMFSILFSFFLLFDRYKVTKLPVCNSYVQFTKLVFHVKIKAPLAFPWENVQNIMPVLSNKKVNSYRSHTVVNYKLH